MSLIYLLDVNIANLNYAIKCSKKHLQKMRSMKRLLTVREKTGKMISDLLKIIYTHAHNEDMVQIVLNKNYVN